jgi:excisionase family DNA binding protein
VIALRVEAVDHPPIEPWIGVDELAQVLSVSIDWVYEKAASGELPSYKFCGHRRFRVSEVEDWACRCASGKMLEANGSGSSAA